MFRVIAFSCCLVNVVASSISKDGVWLDEIVTSIKEHEQTHDLPSSVERELENASNVNVERSMQTKSLDCLEIPVALRVPCPGIGATACGTTCVDTGCCYDPDISNDVQCFKKGYDKPRCDREYKDSCYILVKEALPFQDASHKCRSFGGQLADIDDSAENDVIYQLAAGIGREVYIDGQDIVQEGIWKWTTSSSRMTYTKWNSGEPNDAGGEDCVFIYAHNNGVWNDVRCDYAAPSVCEIKGKPKCDRRYRNSCYVTVADRLDWEEAQKRCIGMGGHLVDISDNAENDLVHQIAAGLGKTVYIDGQDTIQEGVWRWATSGSKMTYVKWNSGEPNNANGEDCASLYEGRDGVWNDVSCRTQLASVCEIKEKPNCDKTYKSSCYVVVNEVLSWEDANSRCNDMGGHLADVSDSRENDVIQHLAAGISSHVWIDGQDAIHEGVWRWANTNAKLTYSKWNTGEPNNAGGEDCLLLYYNVNGAWNDAPCNHKTQSVCEIKARPACDRVFRGSCYIVVREALSFHSADRKCVSMGGQLADISDSSENGVIYELATGIHSAVYIDATDAAREGRWLWATSALPLAYTNWNTGEPNDYGSGEDCALLYHDRDGKWNDVHCHHTAPSVCEIKGIQKRDLLEEETYNAIKSRNLNTMCSPLCQNEGTCSLIGNEYRCVCDPGYTGDSCEIELRYRISTTTAKHEDAKSDDDIYLTLIGETGQCDEAYLNSVNDDFEAGSTDKFRINCGRPIGKLKALSFRSRGPDGWNLERVNVTSAVGSKEYTCNLELSDGKAGICHV